MYVEVSRLNFKCFSAKLLQLSCERKKQSAKLSKKQLLQVAIFFVYMSVYVFCGFIFSFMSVLKSKPFRPLYRSGRGFVFK